MKSIHEYAIDDRVTIMYFGQPCTMKVAETSASEDKIKLQFLTSFGSSWYSPSEIEEHQSRVIEFRSRQYELFQAHTDVDAMGNCYSDADPGL